MRSTYGNDMSRQLPYLQHRGYGLTFRIAVPPDLHSIVGTQEITKALPTANKRHAIPIALEYAACAKRMFGDLRAAMTAPNNDEKQQPGPDFDKLRELMRETKHRLKLNEREEQHQDELLAQRRQHKQELEHAKLIAENEVMRRVLGGSHASSTSTPITAIASPPASPSKPSAPKFKTVIDGFLSKYQRDKKPAMFKKHKPVLTMLVEIIGDKPIDELRQADINDFFELLGNLPPRWRDECRKRKLTIRELAELEHSETLGPKSFDDTYIASVRPFLKAAKKDWQDQGFPLGLTTDGIEYLGDREEGEDKQRAFTPPELRRLFEGPEMNAFANDTAQAHCFWLPLIGLYTGARVNEICQLNPQTDILRDSDSGSWCFWISKETDADPRIKKTVKTGDARKVPIHNKLIELGFLEYVNRVKSAGARLLFPSWQPINRRASGEAEKWFRQLLRDIGLRDETPKANIFGMHAFRHTLLTYGAMQETPYGSGSKTPLSLFCITGHAQDEAPIHATGAGKGYLTLSMLSPLNDRAALLNQLDYGLDFVKPKFI